MYDWQPYVPVAERRRKAKKKMDALRKKGVNVQPIEISGRKIATTFWGKGWCDHMEKFSDFSNRLPRGRTYARNGSVCHLNIKKGKVTAHVYGSSLYNITINIQTLKPKKWSNIKSACAGEVGSLLELLEGRFSKHVMGIVTDAQTGLLPNSQEIDFKCSCPDWADMCKHVAAVFYGIGARLDHEPDQLFLLRGVDHHELIEADLDGGLGIESATSTGSKQVDGDLSSLFGIDLDGDGIAETKAKTKATTTTTTTTKVKTKSKAKVSTATRTKAKAKSKAKSKSKAKASTKQQKIKTEKTTTKKTIAKKTAAFKLTAAGVRRLRKELEMNKRQFSELVGVSSATITNWESMSGKLNLSENSEAGLLKASRLSKKAAWRRIGE